MKKLMEIEVNNNRISFHDFLMFQAQYDIKLKEKNKEIERLNNILNELEKHLQNEISNGRSEDNVWLMGCYDEDRNILDKLQELRGDSK